LDIDTPYRRGKRGRRDHMKLTKKWR
jgi:hypothetical protein